MIKLSLQRLAAFLRYEKIPYVLTGLFLALGWSANSVMTRWREEPIVAYRLAEEQDEGKRVKTISVKNITSDRVFNHLTIMPFFPNSKITRVYAVAPEPPAGLANPSNKAVGWVDWPSAAYDCDLDVSYAKFQIRVLRPGDRYILKFQAETSERPDLKYLTEEDEPLRFVPVGVKTFLLEYELGLLVGAAFIIVLLICLHIVLVAPKE
jgi:hypothetical protein